MEHPESENFDHQALLPFFRKIPDMRLRSVKEVRSFCINLTVADHEYLTFLIFSSRRYWHASKPDKDDYLDRKECIHMYKCAAALPFSLSIVDSTRHMDEVWLLELDDGQKVSGFTQWNGKIYFEKKNKKTHIFKK